MASQSLVGRCERALLPCGGKEKSDPKALLQKIKRYFILIALSAVYSVCPAKKEPIGEWRFDTKTLQGNLLQSSSGTLEGKILGPAVIAKEKPAALQTVNDFAA